MTVKPEMFSAAVVDDTNRCLLRLFLFGLGGKHFHTDEFSVAYLFHV